MTTYVVIGEISQEMVKILASKTFPQIRLLKLNKEVTRNVVANNWQPLRWRHDERHVVSNHRHRDCLLNRLFRRTSKKTHKRIVRGKCFRLMTSSWQWQFSSKQVTNRWDTQTYSGAIINFVLLYTTSESLPSFGLFHGCSNKTPLKYISKRMTCSLWTVHFIVKKYFLTLQEHQLSNWVISPENLGTTKVQDIESHGVQHSEIIFKCACGKCV